MSDETTPRGANGAEAEVMSDTLDLEASQPGGALAEENAALKDQVLRYAAEIENIKRRAERESNDARAYAIQRFARDLLGVADNLARALQHGPKDHADEGVRSFLTGVELTEKELLSAFEKNGLKRVAPAIGEKFDPNLHQAMMEQPSEEAPAGTVISTLQAGYELFGRIVRPALVVVAAKGSGPRTAGYTQPETAAGAGVDTRA